MPRSGRAGVPGGQQRSECKKKTPGAAPPGFRYHVPHCVTLLLSRGATRARLSVGATRRTNSAREPPRDAMLFCLPCLPPAFVPGLTGASPDRYRQPFNAISYSPSLPRFYPLRPRLPVAGFGQSAAPRLLQHYYCRLAVGSVFCLALWAYPGCAGFRGLKVPETLPYQQNTSTPTVLPPHHDIQTATSSGLPLHA